MRRVDQLIAEVREETESTEFTSETGIQDSTILLAFNHAQDRIMSLIQQTKPNLFQKEKVIDAVAGQETYSLPADVFATHMLEKVEYSVTGRDEDYYTLDFGYLRERINRVPGTPAFYIRRSSELLLQPKPQQAGKIRVTYIRTIPKVDARRAKVLSVTLTADSISSLTLDPTALTSDNAQAITDAEYICVVSKDGVIKMKAIPVADLNSSNGDVTVDTFTFESGETIEVGDWIVTGKFSTTHSELPDIAERYLIEFGKWRVHKRDSSNDSGEADAERKEMEADIMATYAEPGKDVNDVPITDTQFLTW